MEDPSVDERTILKWVFKNSGGGMVWIHLAQDRDWWLAFVNAVMNLQFLQNAGNFHAENLVDSQESLWSMKSVIPIKK